MFSPIKAPSAPIQETPPALITRNFTLLFVAHLCFGFSFWPYVLLPVFLQDLGSNLVEIGIIMGFASVAGMLMRPWLGVAIDRFGRKRCLVSGGLIFLSTHIFYLTINHIGWLIYVVRIFHGLGIGILFSTLFTFAADISPVARRTEGIALFGVAGHLSGALSIPLSEALTRSVGYTALFQMCALFTFAFIVLCFFLKEPDNNIETSSIDIKGFLRAAFLRSNRIPLLATWFFALGLISYMTFLKPYAHTLGIQVTSFFLAYSLSAVFIRLIGRKWPDRFGLKTVLYPSLLSLSIGITLLALWPSSTGFLISGILCGTGHGFIFPILSVLLINRAPESARASRITLFTLLFDLGVFIGSPLWGFIAENEGYASMFFLAAFSVLSGLVAFVFLDRPENNASAFKASTISNAR